MFSFFLKKSKIAGSHCKAQFNFMRNCHTVFQSDCTAVPAHPACLRISAAPPCHGPALVLPGCFFMLLALPAGV